MLRSAISSNRQTLAKGVTALHPDSETLKLPQRENMVQKLKKGEEFDLLIIGAGATGSGAALEAASRGLKVACIEREDFASGTSSRSTKLLWGGSRYLVQAFVSLLSTKLITSPVATVTKFYHEFRMVMHAHKERNFMLKKQPHLAHWVPIAVPLTKWFLWPPPFDFAPAAIGPLGLFPLFFKFYDALGGFNAPPSHIMTASRSARKFPQLANKEIKYCSVFYEGMHDDARTNLAIAQTAAIEGAVIVNYCEAVSFLKEKERVVGAVVVDKETNESFSVKAKALLICGGPFTDEVRKLEDSNAKEAVTGASGIHIVLPGYYNPTGIGLVDMSTSDGRFLFFLPWNDHVLVGTTGHKCKANRRPVPDEAEIQWLLQEASKYISPDLQFRRKDVLSAWAGIRPLASDPHALGTAGISRDHVVSHNPSTGVIFISGGKWTTFRQMAEDAIDAVIRWNPLLADPKKERWRESDTINKHYIGYQGYGPNLAIQLIQSHGISSAVANRLARAYGGRATDVLKIAQEEFTSPSPSHHSSHSPSLTALVSEKESSQTVVEERLLVKGFPILEAEVVFATRYEWARHAEDFLAHRSRLAFLNRSAAIRAIPRVVELMAGELGWTASQQENEVKRCLEFMRHMGGAIPLTSQTIGCRMALEGDLLDAFKAVDSSNRGYLLKEELPLFAELMNYVMSEEEIEDCVESYRQSEDLSRLMPTQLPFDHLFDWWNSERLNPGLEQLRKAKMANPMDTSGSGTMFG